MSEAFMGELRIVAFNFAPKGWAMCNGQLLPINQNQALFSLLGTMYGGNGQTNFALPDFRARVPVHVGAGFTQGQAGGSNAHTLSISELPAHTHAVIASGTTADTNAAPGNYWASGGQQIYSNAVDTTMSPALTNPFGGSQAHENRSPFLALTFCINLQGIFPSPN